MLAVPTAAEVTASNITSTNIHPIGPESIWQPALERGLLQGKRCKKRHAVRVVAEVTYRCRGKAGNLRWRKIVPRPPAGPTPAPGPATPVEGDPCTTIGERIEMASGYLECRKVGGDKRVYRHLTVDPPSPGITVSPEPIETCRLLDTRVNRGTATGPRGHAHLRGHRLPGDVGDEAFAAAGRGHHEGRRVAHRFHRCSRRWESTGLARPAVAAGRRLDRAFLRWPTRL